jgi:hypothetical protein
MSLSFQCRSCGQKLDVPGDVVTPVVICPTCGELIAVRDEPRPVEISAPERSEAITPHRPPDQHDIMAHQQAYRSPGDAHPGKEPRRFRLDQAMVRILQKVVPVAMFMIGIAPLALGGRPVGMCAFGFQVPLLLFLLLLLRILWPKAAVGKDEAEVVPFDGCLWVLSTLILLVVTLMCLTLTVCG